MRSSLSTRRIRPGFRPLLERFEERLCPVLTLTQAGIDAGLSLSIFAVDFPQSGSIGPLGITFPKSGGVLVSDHPGNVRLFPTNADGQSAAWYRPAQNYGPSDAFDLAQVGGSIYMAQRQLGRIVQLNDDGTFNRVVVTGTPFPQGMAVNPANGHLFVTASPARQILDVDPVAQTTSVFATTGRDPDGLTVSADGSTLYVALNGDNRVVGYDTATAKVVFDSDVVPGGPDGVIEGTGTLAGNIYVVTNAGTIVEVNLKTLVQTVMATGGSRGDFARVDPSDGSALITQSDRIVRLRFPPVENPVLLYDSYLVSRMNVHENFEVAERQSGRFAPLLYAEGGEPLYSLVNHQDSPDTLWLAGANFNVSGRVALERNLTVDPGLGRAFVMEFDVNPVLTHRPHFNTNQNTWISINFGTTIEFRNRFPNNTDGVSLLFRGNGRTQAFNNSINLGEGRFAPGADDDFHHIRIEVFDAEDGNPFDGSGPATVRAYADGSEEPFFSFVRPNGFASNYISLIGQGEGSGGDGVVRHALTNLLLWLDGCMCAGPGGALGGSFPGSENRLAGLELIAAMELASRRDGCSGGEAFPVSGSPPLTAATRPVGQAAPSTPARVPVPVSITTPTQRATEQLFAETDGWRWDRPAFGVGSRCST